MAEPWMKWTLYEGGTKTASRLLQKYVGAVSGSLHGVFLATFIIGAIQMFSGLIGSPIIHKKSVGASPAQIFGGVALGLFAATSTSIGVFSFTYPGADVGITTFIITMSIIPGAFIDWIFFKHPLVVRQWLGVGVFLSAGYAMMNFPDLAALAVLPPWVLLTFGITFLGAANEGIAQALRKMEPLVNNFWVGLTTVVFAAAGLTVFGGWRIISQLPFRFWVGTVSIGFIVVCMVSFKIMAYKGGGSIALKKLIMQASYLISATFTGWLFYAELLTAGKLIGMAGYLVAFTLMDTGTWEFAWRLGQKVIFLPREHHKDI